MKKVRVISLFLCLLFILGGFSVFAQNEEALPDDGHDHVYAEAEAGAEEVTDCPICKSSTHWYVVHGTEYYYADATYHYHMVNVYDECNDCGWMQLNLDLSYLSFEPHTQPVSSCVCWPPSP